MNFTSGSPSGTPPCKSESFCVFPDILVDYYGDAEPSKTIEVTVSSGKDKLRQDKLRQDKLRQIDAQEDKLRKATCGYIAQDRYFSGSRLASTDWYEL